MTGSAPEHDPIGSGAWANWMWLADIPNWEEALCLSPAPGTIAALERSFARVIEVVPATTASLGERGTATVDLVVVDELGGPRHPGEASVAALLDECNRIVRPGGCVMATAPNPLWYRRFQRRAAVAKTRGFRGLHRSLRRAGFGEIRRYYIVPSRWEPETIVPIQSTAIAQYESMEIKLSTRGGARARLARAGLHFFLYPTILYLAYR